MTRKSHRHHLLATRLKWLMLLLLCLSVSPPVAAQVSLSSHQIDLAGTHQNISLSYFALEASNDDTKWETLLSAGGITVLENVGLNSESGMAIVPFGVAFPDLTLQTSAAYSKAEVDAMIASLESYARRAVRPRYFLTPDPYHGDEALTACGDGFHMASIFELADPSYLIYDTTRGLRTADSGWGPPLSGTVSNPQTTLVRYGWVRTGAFSAGNMNCNLWTSRSDAAFGSVAGAIWDRAELTPGWDVETYLNGPPCASQMSVWCIEDPEMN